MSGLQTHAALAETHSDPALGKTYPPSWLSASIWGIAALFYLAGFYHRVSPAVMTDELMRAFGIGAAKSG